MPVAVVLCRRWCSGRRIVCLWAWPLCVLVGGGPPARSPHASLTARSGRSRSPPVPSGPSGALHTSGAWLLMCGSARRIEARPGPATAHGRRRLALRSLRHPSHLWAGALACAWHVDSLSGRTAVAGGDSRETVNTFAGVCSVFGETDDTIASQIHPFLALFHRAKASGVSYRRPEVPALVLTVTCCGAVSSMGATKFARRGLSVTIARKYAPSAGRMAQNERYIAGWASVFASVGGWGVYWANVSALRHLHQVPKPSTGTEVEPFHECLPSRPTKRAA